MNTYAQYFVTKLYRPTWPDISCTTSCLQNGFTGMAVVLHQDERVKKDIRMCYTCSTNIGCYNCANRTECDLGKETRFFRECVEEDGRFCQSCKDYLCPTCRQEGAFHACEKCNGIECLDCQGEFLIPCMTCVRNKCHKCVGVNREDWWADSGLDEGVCPTCQNQNIDRDG